MFKNGIVKSDTNLTGMHCAPTAESAQIWPVSNTPISLTMFSRESFREFVNERLTAAAEEIFRVVERTVVEYEEEIIRQRRLLDIMRKPELNLHRIGM